jgi:heat shock protein HslJ
MSHLNIRFASLAAAAGILASTFGAHASIAQDATGGIRGTDWQLVSLGDAPLAQGGHGPVAFTLGPDNVLKGTTGCNTIKSGYTLDGSDIAFSMPLTTKKYCASARPTEAAFLNVLQSARGYAVEGDTLTLTAGDGRVLATFAAH